MCHLYNRQIWLEAQFGIKWQEYIQNINELELLDPEDALGLFKQKSPSVGNHLYMLDKFTFISSFFIVPSLHNVCQIQGY